MRPQLEYGSTVWSPHTATGITKLEAVHRRSARWATCDYQCTSSVMQMIKDVNWCTLEQQHIDSRLTLMYKITYDLVAIPAADYLIPNTRQSRHNHQLAYRQIPTLKDYYKFTFFPSTIVLWNALPFYSPVLLLWHNSVMLCAKYYTSHRRYQKCFYLLSILNSGQLIFKYVFSKLFQSKHVLKYDTYMES